jgi:hypothetical protein
MNPYSASVDRGNCLFDRRHTLILSSLVALPFHGRFVGHHLVEGWQLSGILSVHSRAPFTPGDGYDYPGMGAAFVNPRPNLNPGRTWDDIKVGKLEQWFDPTAFSLPPPLELGNAGRDFMIGSRISRSRFFTLERHGDFRKSQTSVPSRVFQYHESSQLGAAQCSHFPAGCHASQSPGRPDHDLGHSHAAGATGSKGHLLISMI